MAHKEKRRKKTLPLLLAALTLAGAGLWWGNYTLSVEEYAALCRRHQAAQGAQQGRFAAAVRTDNRGEVAVRNGDG